jgi:hypothetical protein
MLVLAGWLKKLECKNSPFSCVKSSVDNPEKGWDSLLLSYFLWLVIFCVNRSNCGDERSWISITPSRGLGMADRSLKRLCPTAKRLTQCDRALAYGFRNPQENFLIKPRSHDVSSHQISENLRLNTHKTGVGWATRSLLGFGDRISLLAFVSAPVLQNYSLKIVRCSKPKPCLVLHLSTFLGISMTCLERILWMSQRVHYSFSTLKTLRSACLISTENS